MPPAEAGGGMYAVAMAGGSGRGEAGNANRDGGLEHERRLRVMMRRVDKTFLWLVDFMHAYIGLRYRR